MRWRTSSYSSNGENCVEVGCTPNRMLVRDSKRRDAGMIGFSLSAWATFVRDTAKEPHPVEDAAPVV